MSFNQQEINQALKNFDRTLIDPEGKYPFKGGFRRFELWGMKVLCALQDAKIERTHDLIQITQGSERGVIVLLTDDTIEVRLPHFRSAHTKKGMMEFYLSSRLFRRIEGTEILRLDVRRDEQTLPTAIQEAIDTRLQEYSKCSCCGDNCANEKMEGTLCEFCIWDQPGIL